jgi:hypothetical protein
MPHSKARQRALDDILWSVQGHGQWPQAENENWANLGNPNDGQNSLRTLGGR